MEEKRLFLGNEPSELRDNVSNLFCFCLTEESEGVYSHFIVNDDDGLAEMSLPQAPPLPIPPIPSVSPREPEVELCACNLEFINSHLHLTTGCGSSNVGMSGAWNTVFFGVKRSEDIL